MYFKMTTRPVRYIGKYHCLGFAGCNWRQMPDSTESRGSVQSIENADNHRKMLPVQCSSVHNLSLTLFHFNANPIALKLSNGYHSGKLEQSYEVQRRLSQNFSSENLIACTVVEYGLRGYNHLDHGLYIWKMWQIALVNYKIQIWASPCVSNANARVQCDQMVQGHES